jgi:hypothetical protein
MYLSVGVPFFFSFFVVSLRRLILRQEINLAYNAELSALGPGFFRLVDREAEVCIDFTKVPQFPGTSSSLYCISLL